MASSLIATTVIEDLVDSGLSEEALNVYVDAADARIVQVVGPHSGTRTDGFYFGPYESSKTVFLEHPAESLVSVSRDGTDLDSDDYRLIHGGRAVERVGDYMEWDGDVVVTYNPRVETARRISALVDLVKLALAMDGYSSVTTGSQHMRRALHREREERRILKGLQPQHGGGALLV